MTITINSILMRLALSLVSLIIVDAALVSAQPETHWQIVPVVYGQATEAGRLLWVGIKNKSKDSRMICVLGSGYNIEHPQHEGGHAEGSAHGCRVPEAFQPVRGGETFFVFMATKPKDLQFESAKLSIEFSVYDCAFGHSNCKESGMLTWNGTVQDALNAARTLSP